MVHGDVKIANVAKIKTLGEGLKSILEQILNLALGKFKKADQINIGLCLNGS